MIKLGGSLDAGQPNAGKIRQASFLLPKNSDGLKLKVRAEIESKGGKRRPVNWATAQPTNSDGSITFQLLRRDDPKWGASYIVMTLMFAWFSDTGGYFAGRFLGKHKLYEAVSPKKTVEGAFGGLAGSVVGGLLAHFWFLPVIPLEHVVPLALFAGALGQAGDLGESLLKRSTGVKDSGAIVPGHGGILDRIDALILTSTVVYLYTLWIKHP